MASYPSWMTLCYLGLVFCLDEYFCTGVVYFISNALGGWLATYYSLGEIFIIKGTICLFSLLVVIIMKMKKVF